jgi:hypothetical protein
MNAALLPDHSELRMITAVVLNAMTLLRVVWLKHTSLFTMVSSARVLWVLASWKCTRSSVFPQSCCTFAVRRYLLTANLATALSGALQISGVFQMLFDALGGTIGLCSMEALLSLMWPSCYDHTAVLAADLGPACAISGVLPTSARTSVKSKLLAFPPVWGLSSISYPACRQHQICVHN